MSIIDNLRHIEHPGFMNVNLTPELEKLIQDKVKSGLYNNQSEVVREALRLLVEKDELRQTHLTELRRALAKGLRQADRGQLLDGHEVVREMRALLSARGSDRKK